MWLTSGWFVGLTMAVCVAVVGLIAWKWSLGSGATFRAFVTRFVALGTACVVGLIATLVPLNAEFQWYSSWQDVTSSFGSQRVVMSAGEVHGAAAETAIKTKLPSPLEKIPDSARDLSALKKSDLKKFDYGWYGEFEVADGPSGKSGDVIVIVPPTYFDQPDRDFPAVLTFGGYPSTPKDWIKNVKIGPSLAQEYARGSFGDAVFVIANWLPDRTDSECVNDVDGKLKTEDWLATDVPTWARTKFRVGATRQHWSVMGYSAGGYCAPMLAFRHPGTFSAAVSIAGYTAPIYTKNPMNGYTFPESEELDLVWMAKNEPAPVAVWLFSTAHDHIAGTGIRELPDAVQAPTSLTPVLLPVGGHRFQVWRPYVPSALSWLATVSPEYARR